MNYGGNRNGGSGTATRSQDDTSNYQVLDESELEWTMPVSELHPAGWTRLELIKVEAFFDEESGKKKAKLIFHSEEELENGNPFPISCKTTTNFHPRANITKFLVARGIDPQKIDPRKFKLSDYVQGGPSFGFVMGNITHEPRQDGAGMYAKIDSFAPLPKKKKRGDEEAAFVDEAPTPPPPADPEREAKKRRALEEDDDE